MFGIFEKEQSKKAEAQSAISEPIADLTPEEEETPESYRAVIHFKPGYALPTLDLDVMDGGFHGACDNGAAFLEFELADGTFKYIAKDAVLMVEGPEDPPR